MAVHGNFGMLRKYLEGGTVYPQKRGLGNVAGSAGLVVLSMSCKCLCWLRFMCVHVCEQRMQEHQGKCGVTALACKKPMVHKTKNSNLLLQSKNGNSLNCPCFSAHAFLALITGCHESEFTAQLSPYLFLLCSLTVFLPLSKSAQTECGGDRVGERKQHTGVLVLPKPYNRQDTCCNYPEHCGSWDACKCLSAVLCTVLDQLLFHTDEGDCSLHD